MARKAIEHVSIKVPATSANVGVGYDCLGLALTLFAHVSAEAAEMLAIDGCPDEFRGADNLVWTSYLEASRLIGAQSMPLHITIDSPIPLAGGLGSSSACIVAGVMLAQVFGRGAYEPEEALEIACVIEGHPDNVAPAILGGITCSFRSESGHTHSIRAHVDERFSFVAIVPPYEVRTADARRVMPQTIDISTAIWQMSRCVAVVQAFERGDVALLAEAAHDKLHEPHRAPLIKDYLSAREVAQTAGAVSFLISGSGATMLAVCDGEDDAKSVQQAIQKRFPDFQVSILSADDGGAAVTELS